MTVQYQHCHGWLVGPTLHLETFPKAYRTNVNYRGDSGVLV